VETVGRTFSKSSSTPPNFRHEKWRDLHEVDVRARTQVDAIVRHFAKQDGTDETLKARDQLRWVGLMNNYRHYAEEIILREVVWE